MFSLVDGAVNVPIYWATNGTVIHPLNKDYSGTVLGDPWTIPEPDGGFIIPTGPQLTVSLGMATLVVGRNATVALDLHQVTTYTVQNISQGGGFLGPIQWLTELQRYSLQGLGDDVLSSSSAASGSRVPSLAGILLPEDLERGVIEHVIALSYPQFRNQASYAEVNPPVRQSDYYAPCNSGVSFGSSWRQNALGACQVMRLRPEGTLVNLQNETVDETKFAPVTRMVLRAWREYGAMVVRVGPSMSIISESIITGSLEMSVERASILAGRTLKPGFSLWYQLLLVLAQELSEIPLASQAKNTEFFSFLTPDNLKIDTPNFDIVIGTPGTEAIGESFIEGYNYYGSIDVVLIIIASCFFTPFAVIFGMWLVSRTGDVEQENRHDS